jgi:hypothetical protein
MILASIGDLYRTVGQKTFGYTGSLQSWVVPDGITSITATLTGATGGAVAYYAAGKGAIITTTLTVTPGQTLYFVVGQWGTSLNTSPGVAPYGGGGASGLRGGNAFAGAGGGLSGIFTGATISQANALAIAGGGGGVAARSSWDYTYNYNGGDAGADAPAPTAYPNVGGKKGTLLAGGAAGTQFDSGYTAAVNGSALAGGMGGSIGTSPNAFFSGGGGGGGYYGGGGGAYGGDANGGGGGGSSYSISTITSSSLNPFSTNGSILITW